MWVAQPRTHPHPEGQLEEVREGSELEPGSLALTVVRERLMKNFLDLVCI